MAKLQKKRRGRKSPRGTAMSITEFMERFPDDWAAEKWLEKARWGKKRRYQYCPRCLSWNVLETPNRQPMPYWCGKCRRHFNVRTDTVMAGSKLGYRTWVMAIWIFVTHPKGNSSIQLHRELGVSQKTAWHLAHRIREALSDEDVDEEDEFERFAGPIEVDETFVGGKARNMHFAAWRRNRELPDFGKAIVVGLRDRKTSRVRARVVTKANRKQLQRFVRDHTHRGTTVYSDEAKAYKKGLQREHHTVNHRRRQFADGDCYTNGIESFWATVKRSHKGTYHSWSHKHLQRYLDEFCSRQNMRHKDTLCQMRAVVRGMVGKRLLYRELTGRMD